MDNKMDQILHLLNTLVKQKAINENSKEDDV